MAIVVSGIVFTRSDNAGNPWTEGYFLIEFRDARYTPGGEAMDLSAYMRRVEFMHAQPISGALTYEPRPMATDFPGNAGSGRLTLHYVDSGIVTLHVSGLPIQILSGSIVSLASGMSNAGSGRIGLVGSGAFNAGIVTTEILSGTAVSGVRAYIHTLGY